MFLVRPEGSRFVLVPLAQPRAEPDPVVLGPGREREPSARAADARRLCGRAGVVVGEDQPEGRRDDVEARIRIGQGLAVALVESDLEPRLLLGRGTSLGELVRGDVQPGDLRPGASGDQCDAAGATPEVAEALAGSRGELGDDSLVRRLEGGRDPLVARAAPRG